jgi:hypothetical protein
MNKINLILNRTWRNGSVVFEVDGHLLKGLSSMGVKIA